MTAPEVWFAIPSASPDNCRRVLPAWRAMGYKIAVLQNGTRGDIPADVCVWSDTYPGWAESINILCRDVVPRTSPIIVSGGDDMLPDPHAPAGVIAREFLGRFPDTLGVMQPMGDQLLGASLFCGSPWMGRAWFTRMYRGTGGLCGLYRHNWADNELYWVAQARGRLWCRPDLTQRHEHFTRTGQREPDYWTQHVGAHDRHDVQLFLARAWQRFPAHEPVDVGGHVPGFDHELFEREYPHHAEAYWVQRYGRELAAGEGERRIDQALRQCAQRGELRVALFGAGTHTLGAASVLARPPVPIVAIIDQNTASIGTSLWNIPVVSPDQALALALDAVVLSSRSSEDALARAAQPLAQAGVRVVRLYEPAPGPDAPVIVRERAPALSVIVPVYNAAGTLEASVASVRDQTFGDWELILVDDGSSDDSPALCDRLACQDGRIVVVHQPNRGAAGARNAGLDIARGAHVAFLDADDLVVPEAYERLLHAERTSGCGAAAGSYECFSDDEGTLLTCELSGESLALHDVLSRNSISSISQVIRREALGDLRFDTRYECYEDQDLWIRLAETGVRWRVVESVVARYRMRPGSLSKSDRILADAQRVYTRAQERTGTLSEDELAQRLGDFALGYATRACVGAPERGPERAEAMYERATHTLPITAWRAASMAHSQSIFALGRWPTPGLVGRDGLTLLARLVAWWELCAQHGWMDRRDIPEAIRHFHRLCVHPREIASVLLAGLAPGTRVVLVGHGRNARVLLDAARGLNLDLRVRDGRWPDGRPPAPLPAGLTPEPIDAPIAPESVTIITPVHDQALVALFPGARRWTQAQQELAPGVQPDAAMSR